MKGDHRILGDSAFVMEVLAEAEEKFERFYELKSKGGSEGVVLLLGGCGAGISIGRFGETSFYDWQGVGYAVRRGERIAKANNYSLID